MVNLTMEKLNENINGLTLEWLKYPTYSFANRYGQV